MGRLNICYFIESVETGKCVRGKREVYDTLDEAVKSMHRFKNRGKLVVREAVGSDVLGSYKDGNKPKSRHDIKLIGTTCATNWTDDPDDFFEYDYECEDSDWETVYT